MLTRPSATIVRRYIEDAQAILHARLPTAFKPMSLSEIHNLPANNEFSLSFSPVRKVYRGTRLNLQNRYEYINFDQDFKLNPRNGNILVSRLSEVTTGGSIASGQTAQLQFGYIYGHDTSHRLFGVVSNFTRTYAARAVLLLSILNSQFGTTNSGIIQNQINLLTNVLGLASDTLDLTNMKVV